MGHIARDCNVDVRVEEKQKHGSKAAEIKKESGLICYNCRGRGHTSRQCPSRAMYCGRRKGRRLETICRGLVEDVDIDDILLDTGCSRTVVRRELVKPNKLIQGKFVEIQCAHGDTISYPVALVDLLIKGRKITVEAAVSDTLPQSVLLGVDVPELKKLVAVNQDDDRAFATTTRSMARRNQQEEIERRERQRESGVIVRNLMNEGSDERAENEKTDERAEDEVMTEETCERAEDEKIRDERAENEETDERAEDEEETGERAEDEKIRDERAENEETDERAEGDNGTREDRVFEFEDDLFDRSRNCKERLTRSQKRASRHRYGRVKSDEEILDVDKTSRSRQGYPRTYQGSRHQASVLQEGRCNIQSVETTKLDERDFIGSRY